jgi:heme oxygenase
MSLLLDRLRQETQRLHQQTEQLFYTEPLRNGTLSPAQYVHLLRTHLAFHQALETAIDNHSDFFREYDPQARIKTPWLAADLAHLKEFPSPCMPALFTNWSAVDLLGAIYVGEGSMLGGTVINRLLQQSTSIQSILPVASRFYQGYGADMGKLWRRGGEFITQHGDSHADAVVAAAKRAFSQYQQAFLSSQASVTQE